MPDLLQTQLDVTVENELYVFEIPTLKDEIALGLREREIRRNLEREVFGPTYPAMGLPTSDQATEFLVRTTAYFEHLLRKGPEWVYSMDGNGSPTIDFQKWPRNKVDTVVSVGMAFEGALRSFRAGGAPNGNAAGREDVAGQQDTGAPQPVPPGPAPA